MMYIPSTQTPALKMRFTGTSGQKNNSWTYFGLTVVSESLTFDNLTTLQSGSITSNIEAILGPSSNRLTITGKNQVTFSCPQFTVEVLYL